MSWRLLVLLQHYRETLLRSLNFNTAEYLKIVLVIYIYIKMSADKSI